MHHVGRLQFLQMRIVELVNNLTIGGAERMATDLAVGLSRLGHEVRVVGLRGGGPLVSVLGEAGVEVFCGENANGFNIKALRSLAHYIGDRGADVLHTHNPLTHHYGVLAARMAKVPVVVNTFHGPGNLTGFGRTQIVFEASCLFTDRVVACCQSVEEHVRRVTRVARSKVTMIPNGIALERFLAITPTLSKDDLVFGAVGRLAAVKDQASLIEAFASLLRGRPNCRLEILGEGPLRGALEEKASQFGIADRVTFHGSSLDVASFLSRLHVFVLCSLSEGLPLTLLEAMAAGLPVVGTDVGEIPELVRAGECGWLCPPGNPEQLAVALSAAAGSDSRLRMGSRGREYVVKRHSISLMVDGYRRLFEQMCSPPGGHRRVDP